MDKQKSIFKGDKVRRLYSFQDGFYARVEDRYENIEKDITFYSCDFDIPTLEVDESIYINDLDKKLTVKDKARSVDGEIVYYIRQPFEIVEDEKSKVSLDQAELDLKEYIANKKVTEENEAKKLKNRWKRFKKIFIN